MSLAPITPEIERSAASMWSSALVEGVEGKMTSEDVQKMRPTAGDVMVGAIVAGANQEQARSIAVGIHMTQADIPYEFGSENLGLNGAAGIAAYIAIDKTLNDISINAGGVRG